jgi:hypothetical protein
VLLVDGDRQQQAAMMALRDEDDEQQEKLMRLANRVVRTPWDGVKFLRVFAPGNNEQQTAYGMRDAIMGKAEKFDVIVIDGGSPSSDPAVRAFPTFVDDILIVVERGHTTRDQLRDGLEALGPTQVKLEGAVLAG